MSTSDALFIVVVASLLAFGFGLAKGNDQVHVKITCPTFMNEYDTLSHNISLYLGTKRKSDWDNFHKISTDALSGIVWEDDSQITDATVHRRYDKENPRIEIRIEEAA